jgi:hypothetical protein
MHITFRSLLQTHRCHHPPDSLEQCAVLLYQSQQQCRPSAGPVNGWSFDTIDDRLVEVREDLFNEQRAQQTAITIKARKPKRPCAPILTLLQIYPPPCAYHMRTMLSAIVCRQNNSFTCNMHQEHHTFPTNSALRATMGRQLIYVQHATPH